MIFPRRRHPFDCSTCTAARPADHRHPGVDQRSVRRRPLAIAAVQLPINLARRDPVRQQLRRDRPVKQDGYAPGELSGITFEAPASSRRAIPTASSSSRRPDRAGRLPQPAGSAAPGRQPGRAPCLRRPTGGVPGSGTYGSLAGGRAGGVQRRPDRRAGQHDHRAAHLPGQRADHLDAGPGAADLDQPALIVAEPLTLNPV
jgi:hypothetical protein